MLLGCIADDLTGATDLALTLVKNGLSAIQTIGVPETLPNDADGVVIALKTRTVNADEAVSQSLAAMRALQEKGARKIYFKYCSTFDSTPAGNIGPVADALLDAMGEPFTVACPAFPENGRTVYRGNLFVGDHLLSESSMRHHPLTPMTDSNLVRVLGRQTKHVVGLIPYEDVDAGPEAIRSAFNRLRDAGVRHAIVDALSDQHLRAIGDASSELRLVTGGSGLARGLFGNTRVQSQGTPFPRASGPCAVVSGSCSAATLAQIEAMRRTAPAYKVDPLKVAQGIDVVGAALNWAQANLSRGPVLIYASAPPEEVAATQARLGREEAGSLIENALARIVAGLVGLGVRRLIVAGGETSGAAVHSLDVRALRIGPEIAPGVPWTLALDERGLFLALKSGNFGGPDFFLQAFEVLQ